MRRRTLLLGAAGTGTLALLGGGGALLDDRWSGGVRTRRLLGLTGPDGTVPAEPVSGPSVVTAHRVHSAARGTEVNLITVVPPGAQSSPLPVCLLLHGRYMNASSVIGLGMPNFLDAAIRAGSAPFALVAVDGGNSYWLARTPRDDPQAMLLHELPGWLTQFGLPADGGVPRTVLGISMGCFGALVYARTRASAPHSAAPTIPPPAVPGSAVPGTAGHPPPVPGAAVPGAAVPPSTLPSASVPGASVPGAGAPGAAVPGAAGSPSGSAVPGAAMPGSAGQSNTAPSAIALLSPAVFRSWKDARTVHAFANEAGWAAAEPLRHPGPAARLGVWCGREDPFCPAARQLIAQRHPLLARLDHGAHTPGYWRRVLPEALRFVSPHPAR